MNPTNIVRLFEEPQNLGGRLPTRAEVVEKWQRELPQLMHTARWAVQWAHSYRATPKHYGVAMLVCRCAERAEDRFGITFGWNCTIMQRPKDAWWPKPCGERAALNDAQARGFTMVGGLVVFTNNIQSDDMSEVVCNVQDPCFECREMLLAAGIPIWAPILSFRDRLPCDLNEPGTKDFVTQSSSFLEVLRRHKHESKKDQR